MVTENSQLHTRLNVVSGYLYRKSETFFKKIDKLKDFYYSRRNDLISSHYFLAERR